MTTNHEITVKNKLFWAWNGALKEEEIRRQIRDFREKGFGGFYLHARCGLLIPYMGEEWMSAIKTAVDEAKAQGLEVWLYDENGWPSGFGGGVVNGAGEDFCQKNFSLVEGEAKAPLARYIACESCTPPLPGERYAAYGNAGYRVCKEGERAALSVAVEVNRYYADIFNPNATALFLRSTHERYKEAVGSEFGGTVKGIFTDEPQYCAHPYSPYLFDAFERAKGYRAENWLFLFSQESRAGMVFREDFYDVVCRLFKQNYVDAISAWCRENGLYFTGHFPEEDGISTQFLKGGDIMLNYVGMDYPGIDYLGRRLPSEVLLRQLASVKNQLGKRHVNSESFGCCGWNTTLEQYRRIWGYQSAFGIDTACLHLAAYTIRGQRKRDYPAFFSYQSSWWEHIGALNSFMETLNEFASRGEPVNDVLVISPVYAAYSRVARSARAGFLSTQFRTLCESFTDLQMQFDIASENYLEEVGAAVKDGKVAVGRMRYRVVVLSDADCVKDSTRLLLEEAERQGVKVVFSGEKFTCAEGVPCEPPRYGDVVQNRRALWEKYFLSIGYEKRAVVVNADGAAVDGLIVRVREDAEKIYLSVYNKSEDGRSGTLKISALGALNSLENGPVCGFTDGVHTFAPLNIAPAATRLFVFEKGGAIAAEEAITCSAERLIPEKRELVSANTFAIDRVSLSFGEGYGEEQYVLHAQEAVHARARTLRENETVRVRYRFTLRGKPRRLKLSCETDTADMIALNGTPLGFAGTFLDQSVKTADISALAREGENELVFTYTVKPVKQDFDLKRVFETEKNKFAYDAEIESVYLAGDFDVRAIGEVRETPAYYRVGEEGFELIPPQEKDLDEELTRQGLWFYRGNVKSRYLLRYTGGKVSLLLRGAKGVLTAFRINGVPAGYLSGEEELNVTPYLKEGENVVESELVGSNRNLLGPHHHYSGEPRFVGVNTYKGTKGYEDDVVSVAVPENTYVPSYAFVKYEVGTLYAVRKTDKKRRKE